LASTCCSCNLPALKLTAEMFVMVLCMRAHM
jgi:hypothetical protein